MHVAVVAAGVVVPVVVVGAAEVVGVVAQTPAIGLNDLSKQVDL